MKKLLYPCFITLIVVGLKASPYAPTSVSHTPQGDRTYTYNTMGQRLNDGQGQLIEWSLIDQPEKITTDEAEETFAYGPGGQRYLREHADGSKTFYVGGMEYRVAKDGTRKSVVYIRNGSYSPVAMVDTSDSSPEYTYFLKDHLGSALVAVDDSGAIVTDKSHGRHDPWGQPWSADGAAQPLKEESRGFTGHENIASAGLVHMNGRVYDPMIGQFLGPDRFLQNASRMVGLNRYAYIGNSPVNGTDPSGWITEGEKILKMREIENRKFLKKLPDYQYSMRNMQHMYEKLRNGMVKGTMSQKEMATLMHNEVTRASFIDMAHYNLVDQFRDAGALPNPKDFKVSKHFQEPTVKLYRGVPIDELKDYNDALNGVATPLKHPNGIVDPIVQFMWGERHTNLTSWSKYENIAKKYAYSTPVGGISSGILLSKEFKKSEVIPVSFKEGEYAVIGKVEGAESQPVFKINP